MKNENQFPTKYIHLLEEYVPYATVTKIPYGHIVSIDIPYKYDINFKIYDLTPGVSIIINHSILQDEYKDHNRVHWIENPYDLLIINYQVKGQCKIKVGKDKYMFIKNNDISLYTKDNNEKNFSYLDENLILYILINRKQLKNSVPGYNKYFMEMIDKLFDIAEMNESIVFKSNEKINNIIQEIINFKYVNPVSDVIHMQLKTFEVILNLYESEIKDEKITKRTYTDTQIRVVRNIKNTLTRDISSYVSLDVLSASYGINLTILKNCFKDMYGRPLYSWYREYKFQRAQELIKNTDYPMSKIAHMVGYKSSSKFSKAFKQETGVLPSTYRKNNQ